MTADRPVQGPERSGWPSAPRGPGAARSGFPSDVRGIFGVGWLSHCALAGRTTAANDTASVTVSAPLILTSQELKLCAATCRPRLPPCLRRKACISEGGELL